MKPWKEEFDSGATAAQSTPWISLKGRSDAFRQGFYSITSSALHQKAYSHVVEYEAWVDGNWLVNRFHTTKDAVEIHKASLLSTLTCKNIVITEIKK